MIIRQMLNVRYVYEIRVRSVLGADNYYRSGLTPSGVSADLLAELRKKNHGISYAVINTQKLGKSYK
jgi:hypothetical protein